jgi:hypothetical protein
MLAAPSRLFGLGLVARSSGAAVTVLRPLASRWQRVRAMATAEAASDDDDADEEETAAKQPEQPVEQKKKQEAKIADANHRAESESQN